MTKDFTAEEMVTRLLASKEILKPKKENFYITSTSDLGSYLNNLPKVENNSAYNKKEKYTFIQEGRWHF